MKLSDFFDLVVVNQELICRYLLNLLFAFILTRLVYYRNYKRSDLFLTFFAFNSIIFFVSFMLNKVELSTGAAFGLFAVFSILRYRTEGISAKDMTYLFLNIAIGLLTAVSIGTFLDITLICIAILVITYLLEGRIFIRNELSKTIQYDDIRLVHEEHQMLLLEDLRKRTGLHITRFEIHHIDFLKDACSITIYYSEK